MSKIIKIWIFLFILILFISFNNISSLSMDIENISTNEDATQDTNIDDTTTDTNANFENNNESLNVSDELTDDEEYNDETLVPTINSNQSSLPESNLGLTNVINILLIVVGFVLILLGIAIILRLRR